jgi:glycosyltransferase involved in cell wall biosynthesis
MTKERALIVSVVIPAYNAAGFISKTLDSIRAQTFTAYEIVVVDDGSSDETHRVVEDYLRQHGLHGRCIRQENKKIAGARNTGMRESRGTYIALLDHDDLWYPQKLAVVMAEFDRHPEADLICHNENITREGRVVRMSRNGPNERNLYERLLFSGNRLSPSATVFRREKALSIGGFREDPGFNTAEDYDFWMRFSRIACFHFIDVVLGEYQLVDRAASRRIEYHHANMENVLRDHFRSYLGERPTLMSQLRIRRRLSMNYRSAATQLMQFNESPAKQREYVARMLRAYPFEPRNFARCLLWVVRSFRNGQVESASRA